MVSRQDKVARRGDGGPPLSICKTRSSSPGVAPAGSIPPWGIDRTAEDRERKRVRHGPSAACSRFVARPMAALPGESHAQGGPRHGREGEAEGGRGKVGGKGEG